MVKVLASARVYDQQVGGNTRYARTVYERLPQEGVSVEFARPTTAISSRRARSAVYALFESVLWPHTRRTDVDVLHFPADTGAVVRGRLPIVSTIHGLATLHVDSVRSRGSDWLWRTRVARLAAASTAIITVSESSAADIARFAPETAGRITVIHHGIDHERFRPTTRDESASALAEIGVPDRYFLYVGNLDPRKNIPQLAAAGAHVFRRTGVPLVIAGAPAWESDEIMKAVTNTDGVIYIGRVAEEHLTHLMTHALAFCFPSTYEGFGFPVLEAMACGTPVICSDRGSLREVAADNAFVLSDIDAATIQSAMIELEADSGMQNELRNRGLARAAEFSWERSVAQHAQLFREVAR